ADDIVEGVVEEGVKALPAHRPPVPELGPDDLWGVGIGPDDPNDPDPTEAKFLKRVEETLGEHHRTYAENHIESTKRAATCANLIETLARLEWNGHDRDLARLPEYRLVERLHTSWNPETRDALRKE